MGDDIKTCDGCEHLDYLVEWHYRKWECYYPEIGCSLEVYHDIDDIVEEKSLPPITTPDDCPLKRSSL